MRATDEFYSAAMRKENEAMAKMSAVASFLLRGPALPQETVDRINAECDAKWEAERPAREEARRIEMAGYHARFDGRLPDGWFISEKSFWGCVCFERGDDIRLREQPAKPGDYYKGRPGQFFAEGGGTHDYDWGTIEADGTVETYIRDYGYGKIKIWDDPIQAMKELDVLCPRGKNRA